jgi:hypothetical protein
MLIGVEKYFILPTPCNEEQDKFTNKNEHIRFSFIDGEKEEWPEMSWNKYTENLLTHIWDEYADGDWNWL